MLVINILLDRVEQELSFKTQKKKKIIILIYLFILLLNLNNDLKQLLHTFLLLMFVHQSMLNQLSREKYIYTLIRICK